MLSSFSTEFLKASSIYPDYAVVDSNINFKTLIIVKDDNYYEKKLINVIEHEIRFYLTVILLQQFIYINNKNSISWVLNIPAQASAGISQKLHDSTNVIEMSDSIESLYICCDVVIRDSECEQFLGARRTAASRIAGARRTCRNLVISVHQDSCFQINAVVVRSLLDAGYMQRSRVCGSK